MPSEPRPEQIVTQIVANLNAISGASYHFPQPRACRADKLDTSLLQAGLDTVYFVTPEAKEENRATNDGPGCIIRGRAFYVLTLCGRTKQGSVNPLQPDVPIVATVQERMAADVRLKLRADPSLGGISTDLLLTDSEENPNDTAVAGWAIVFMRLQVTYHYRKDLV